MTGPGVVAGILLLGAGTFAMKAVGPVLVGGGRAVPHGVVAAGTVLPTALLSALVATDLLGSGAPDAARLAGAAVAALLVVLRAPFVAVVLGGTVSAAVLRALGA